MNTEHLLAGPRGRRLCLEWARRLDQEQAGTYGSPLHLALFQVAGELRPSDGSATATASTERSGSASAHAPIPEQIPRLIDHVVPRPPSQRETLLLLAETVGTAMYWQPPWEEDLIAARATVRKALVPVAEAIADARTTGWWTEPLEAGRQWATQPAWPQELGTPPAPPAASAPGILQNADEDVSGHWWSTPPGWLSSSTRYLEDFGPVGLWVVEDSMDPDLTIATHLRTPDDCHVAEITCAQDWIDLCAAFPCDVSASRRGVWGEATGREGGWVMPDWLAAADSGIDAVHLTVGGYLAAAGRALPITSTQATVLGGWNPDATYWLRTIPAASQPVVWKLDPQLDTDEPGFTFHIAS